MSPWYETHRSMLYPSMCDAQGHLNTAGYMQIFDSAIFQVMFCLGYSIQDCEEKHIGWADVTHNIEYRKELRAGWPIFVRSQAIEFGRKSLTTQHEMYVVGSFEAAATLKAKTVQFDLKRRIAVELLSSISGKLT